MISICSHAVYIFIRSSTTSSKGEGGSSVLAGKKVILSHVILFLHVYLYVQFNFKCLFYLFIHLQISFEEK